MADAGDEVVFRHVNRNDLERRSRPESAHKGNLKRLKTSSVGGFQRWEKENELLWAMLEDETEWLGKLFPDIIITPELFFYALEDGVVLCRLANLIQEASEEYGKKNKVRVPAKRFKFHTSIPKKNKQLALFKSRENVQGFLTWCRQIGISDSILFESNDVVEADECREGCREVVICLMEIARRAAAMFKFTPIPKLIQLEKEIEIEEQKEAEENAQDEVDYASSDEESNRSCPSPEAHFPPAHDASTHTPTEENKKKKTRRLKPKSELDQEVLKIIDNFNVYNIRKIKEGKYMILGKIIFVRMLNGHILLRIGGGWDTLEHYLLTHIPKVASENGDCSTEAAVAPSVSKTPQKSQITKILDKVKKEQQLKATPSPYRTAGRSGSKSDDEDDEKDITSAIRKIEFSVNQNIATRRKVSRHSLEETPQKSPNSVEESSLNTPSDINQNSLPEKISKSQRRKSKNMESEANVFHGHNGDVFNPEQQNGEVMNFEDAHVKESNVESLSSADMNDTTDNNTDVIDGAILAKLNAESTAVASETEQEGSKEVDFEFHVDTTSPNDNEQSSNQLEICLGNSEEHLAEPCPPAEVKTEDIDVLPNESAKNENEDFEVSASIPDSASPEVPPNVPDVPPVIPEGSKTSGSPSPEPTSLASTTPDAPQSPQKSPSPSEKKDGAEPPKKKTAKTSKDPTKIKPAATKAPGKKEPANTAGSRPKSAKPSTRPNTTDSLAAKNTKRPTSGVKTSTTTAAKSSATTAAKSNTTAAAKPKTPVAGKPSTTASKTKNPPSGKPTTATSTTSGRTSPTKKPASKPDPKPTRPAKTTAFGSTVSNGPPKKSAPKTRPATAPPARTATTQAKKKPVAPKVQSWSSTTARPQSAKPSTKAKDATDGVAASKETGDNRPTSPTKPLVRKTQTRTLTTTKTTRVGAGGAPETKSQTLKTTRTVTEANGKKTTKTTVKEISPTGRKPLRITTETTEGGTGGKKPTKAVADSKTGTRTTKTGAKKPETKNGAKTGPTKPNKEIGAKKAPTKTAPKGKELKGGINEVPKAKTVKELSNALGITKTSDENKKNDEKIKTEPKEGVEKEVEEPTEKTPDLAPAKVEVVEESVKVEETLKAAESPEVEETVKAAESPEAEESVKAAEYPEVEESVKTAESPDVEESVTAAEVEQSGKDEEFLQVDESVEVDKSVEVEQSTEVEESAKVEPAKVEEFPDVDESVKTAESPDVEESVTAAESPEVEQYGKDEEFLQVDESVEVDKSVEVEQSTEVEESVKVEPAKVEEFPDVDESVKTAESPDVEESVTAAESPEVEQYGKDEEFLQVDESVEVDKSVEVEQSTEVEESVKVEPAKVEEFPDVDESVKTAESPDVEESVTAAESPEVEQYGKDEEFLQVDESVEVDKSVEVEQSTVVEESVKVEPAKVEEFPDVEESAREKELVQIDESEVEQSATVEEAEREEEFMQVEEPSQVDESGKVEELPQVDESVEIEESTHIDESVKVVESPQDAENLKEEEFVQVDESPRVEVSPEPETVAPVCEEIAETDQDGEAETVNDEGEMVPQGQVAEDVIQGTEEERIQSVVAETDVTTDETTDETNLHDAVVGVTANDIELTEDDDAFVSTEKTENVMIEDSLEEDRDPLEAIDQDTHEFQGMSDVIVQDSPELRDPSGIVDESLDEDSLDVIVVPESDVSQEENALQSTEAWPAVSGGKEHLQDVDLLGDNNNAIEETEPKLDPYLSSSDAYPHEPADTTADQNLFDISADGKAEPWFSGDAEITGEPINRDSGFQESSTVDDLLG